jgi:hypothetical protein
MCLCSLVSAFLFFASVRELVTCRYEYARSHQPTRRSIGRRGKRSRKESDRELIHQPHTITYTFLRAVTGSKKKKNSAAREVLDGSPEFSFFFFHASFQRAKGRERGHPPLTVLMTSVACFLLLLLLLLIRLCCT